MHNVARTLLASITVERDAIMVVRQHASAQRRERMWTWTFWAAIAAFEALGLFLTNLS
jgi:hypothetical protein